MFGYNFCYLRISSFNSPQLWSLPIKPYGWTCYTGLVKNEIKCIINQMIENLFSYKKHLSAKRQEMTGSPHRLIFDKLNFKQNTLAINITRIYKNSDDQNGDS